MKYIEESMNTSNLSDTAAPDIKMAAFTYWMHCNQCYEFFYRKTKRLYLLSCQHILCQDCIVKKSTSNSTSTDNTKPMYKCNKCSRIVPACLITNDMPSHLKDLFHPTPWLNNLLTAHIYKFQLNHRAHLRKAMVALELKITRHEELFLKNAQTHNMEQTKFVALKHDNVKLERRVRPILAAYKRRKLFKAQQNLNNTFSSHGGRNSGNTSLPNQRFAIPLMPNSRLSFRRSDNGNVKSSSHQKTSNSTCFLQRKPKSAFLL